MSRPTMGSCRLALAALLSAAALLTMCTLVGAPCTAAEAAVTPVGSGGQTAKWYADKDLWAVLGGFVTLRGLTVPLIAKGVESVSLTTRKKRELQQIDDVTALMEKVNKFEPLPQPARDKIAEQLERELDAALAALNRNLENRRQILARVTQAQEIREAEQSDLPLMRRIFLLRPHGSLAWAAHGVTILYAFVLLSVVWDTVLSGSPLDSSLLFGSALFLVIAWLVAQRRRSRWVKLQRARTTLS